MSRENLTAIALGSLLGAALGVAGFALLTDAHVDAEASATTITTEGASGVTARPTGPGTTTTVGAAASPDPTEDAGDTGGGTNEQPPPSTEPVEDSASVGYVGCSNSSEAVEGYRTLVGEGVFWPSYPGGGGDINRWALNTDSIWQGFEEAVALHGPLESVWFQVCEHENDPATIETLRSAIENIRTRVPSAVLYLSPLNSYDPATMCERLGPDGISDLVTMVDQAIAEGLASQGPQLGPLTVATTRGDRCHPNRDGMALLGSQLEAFFGS